MDAKKPTKAKLKAKDQNERLDKWKTHFEQLLGNKPQVTNKAVEKIVEHELSIKKGNFSKEELEKVLTKIQNGKACGLDNIPPEVWKTGNFNDELLAFCNAVYNQENIERWKEGCILPFPKKGDLGVTTNYRGITLTAIAAKIYILLLLNRIRPIMEKMLRKNQNGFRPNRSTVGQILTVPRLIEGIKTKNLDAVIIFVDFSKAFDSIHRDKLKEILLAYGIPLETVLAIMMLYKDTSAMVRSPDGDTSLFDIVAGVLQGDTLAPFLFIIALDYVLRISVDKMKELGFTLAKYKSRRYPAEKITDIDYADDLTITSDNLQNATKLLHSIEEAAQETGLYINPKKTKFITYNVEGQMSSLSGSKIKHVSSFVYLGSNIHSTNKDIEVRKAKAWSALSGLNKIWKSNLPPHLKREFFCVTVESVLLYGSSTWTLTKQQTSNLDGTYTKMLRTVLNISWRQHPTKKELYGHLQPVSNKIKERRLRFSGHCWRSKNELASYLLLWKPQHGINYVGHPCRTYIDQLCDDSECYLSDLSTAMMDRDGWKERVKRVRDINSIQ